MDKQLMKQIVRWAAVGSVGLMIGSSVTAGFKHRDEPEREQVNPSCHPTFGYHQTCWRRFPPLPPCPVCQECQECQQGLNSYSQPTLQDGSGPFTPLDIEYSPQNDSPNISPVPQPDSMSGFSPGPASGRYGGHTVMPSPGASGTSPIYSEPPAMMTPGPAMGGRYQTGPASSAAQPAAPMTQPQAVPQTAPSAPAASNPAGLPPVPGPAPQSSGHAFPNQSLTLPGGGRYRGASAVTTGASVHTATQARPVAAKPLITPPVQRQTVQPVTQPASQPQGRVSASSVSRNAAIYGFQDRTPLRPQPAPLQAPIAPLLRLPVAR